jgi:hypothetical protein
MLARMEFLAESKLSPVLRVKVPLEMYKSRLQLQVPGMQACCNYQRVAVQLDLELILS